MAGDWIKMRSDLFTHPKVVRISSALKADTLRTVGGLMSVWCLFDAHSVDGRLEGYTPDYLDAHLRWEGFAEAMVAVGWLISDDQGLALPRFDTHNGQSAKRRAQDADRKREVRKVSASEADKKRTREEKRREEINTPQPPAGELFDRFWAAYPKKVGKDDAKRAFDKRKPNAELLSAMLAALEVQKQSPSWTKDNGQFIPNPSTWLNQGRWQDELGEVTTIGDWKANPMFAGVI
jgi:hypothetical protein